MSTSENNSPVEIISTQTPTQNLLNINMNNVSKLTATNYLMWSRQVRALLDGYGLGGHLDGSMIVPAETLNVDGEIFVNPAYTIWKRQDQLIYSASSVPCLSKFNPLSLAQPLHLTCGTLYLPPMPIQAEATSNNLSNNEELEERK